MYDYGLAKLIGTYNSEKLKNEYEPDNILPKIVFIREFSAIRMKISDSPKELFDKIVCIKKYLREVHFI